MIDGDERAASRVGHRASLSLAAREVPAGGRLEDAKPGRRFSIAFVMTVTGMIIGSAFTLPELGEIAV